MHEILSECRVLPVVTANDVETTVQLAKTLEKGGMRAVEITLRTGAALDAIRAVKAEVPGVRVAAGTIANPDDLARAIAAGADFFVSPGSTGQLLAAAVEAGVDFLPGIATASELMLAMDHGFGHFKLFPAVAAGGISLLKGFGGPFPGAYFCPTGGLNRQNFRDFLALPNVLCCGGSWMVADDLVNGGEWLQIEHLAQEAMGDTENYLQGESNVTG
jgi:2-dehydro-3-deoxyphosphogluconate aldolase/(4S)-4-hydroxy-2-oxoglutarate aldolase